MFKKIISTSFFILIFIQINAQTDNVFSISLSELGPAYELSLSKKLTAKIQIGIYATSQTYINFSALEPNTTPTLNPTYFLHGGINSSLRNYYNFERRLSKGKKITNNTGNYFAIVNMYMLKPFLSFGESCYCDGAYGLTLGQVWGMQRNYRNRISLDFNFGIGYAFNSKSVAPIATTTFGIYLGERK